MRFADPACLGLLLVAVGYAWRQWPRRGRVPPVYLAVPWLARLEEGSAGPRARWAWLPAALRTAVLGLLVVALARPQTAGDVREATTRSRNIVVALDISSSMKALDYPPGDRLDAARRVLADFAARREQDLLGLVLFAGQAFVQVPLTVDVDLLLEMLRRAEIGLLPDGTAIGTALATSLNLVKDLPAGSSAVVLVTDGGNNTGRPGPLTAAEAARALGIRVYAIGLSPGARGAAANGAAGQRPAGAGAGPGHADGAGAGVPGAATGGPDGGPPAAGAPARMSGADEEILRRIAARTGGGYYRAADPDALARVAAEIDRLERTEVRIKEAGQYRDRYPLALVPAVALLVLEALLRATWLRALP